MSKRIACIKDNIVQNIIISTSDFANTLGFDEIVVLDAIPAKPSTGWRYDGDNQFSAKQLALIKNSIVVDIEYLDITYAEALDYDEVIDLTTVIPLPMVGDTYENGVFSSKGIILTVYEFRQLLTLAERVAITEAGKTDSMITTFLADLQVAPNVELNDPDLLAALDYFISNSLLTRARRDQVLNNGTHPLKIFTVVIETNILEHTDHGFENDTEVNVSSLGTLPTGLSVETLYYVVNKNADDFQLSTSQGGSALDIIDLGVETHYVFRV